MTTLATNTPRVLVGGDVNEIPVIATDIIYEGAAVGVVTASGHARPLTGADRFAGFAVEKADNAAGAAAAINVRTWRKGCARLTVSGATITDVGQPVYATDDDTFVFLPTGAAFIGFVRRWVATNVVEVEFDVDNYVDPYAGKHKETLSTSTKTLDAEDTGKVIFVTADCVITNPATATALLGVQLVCMGAYGTVQISLSPNSADKVMGPDIGGTDNKDLINTKATAQRGDYIIYSNGHADGPVVSGIKGTWATEG